MDTRLAVPRISAAPALGVRPEPPAVRQAVSTELGASKSVVASGTLTATAAYDPALVETAKPETARGVVVDPQTREVIFREISKRSGEVISQVPGDAMLKLMAYYREILHPEPDHKVVAKSS
jgi:hypothetical protein